MARRDHFEAVLQGFELDQGHVLLRALLQDLDCRGAAEGREHLGDSFDCARVPFHAGDVESAGGGIDSDRLGSSEAE